MKNFQIFFVAVASLLLFKLAHADEASYISEVNTIEELYQACLNTIAKTDNIYCIKGKDETTSGQKKELSESVSSPYEILFKSANKNEIERNNPDDLGIIFQMKLGGDVPITGNVYHYGFVHIYKSFYAYSRAPVVKATASLYTVQPGRVGLGYYANNSVRNWFEEKLKVLPMAKLNSEDGKLIAAKYQAMVDEIFQKERDAQNRISEKTKPTCREIKFTGIGAFFPEDLNTVNKSKNKAELLDEYPMVCNTVSGGRNYNGAILNPWSRTQCKGIGFFQNQRGFIQSWTSDAYYVASDVNFNTGRMPVALWINRTSATCVK